MNRIQLLAFIIAAAMAVALCLCFTLFGIAAGESTKTVELQQRINPNLATPESLARLPGIGLTRAQAIVTYREDFQKNNESDPAFRDCNDLKNVKGIGPVTAENMCKWLKFQ